MPQILRTTLIPNEAQAADGAPQYDLPVNPLSHILLTVKQLNDNAAITGYTWITGLLNAITDVRVSYRGASIIQGSLTDLAVTFGALAGWGPHQGNAVEDDNEIRWVTVPLLFGRRPYDQNECFPATRRGDLILQLQTDIAHDALDALVLQAETCELLDAKPAAFTKITTTQKILDAVTEHDIELPIGNDLIGILLGTDVPPQAAAYTSQFGRVAIETDNVETYYSEANWETLHGELMRLASGLVTLRPHTHSLDAAVAGRTTTSEQQEGHNASSLLDNYAYIDLDPMKDLSYALKTTGAARVNLRVDTTLADPAAMRVLPIEYVRLAAAAGAA